ncbi:MAG: hypothetical protein SV422_14495, partial [Pseudomonadota bacterium]|nr:hypothetical protein [Pseudomonadota bacterium]
LTGTLVLAACEGTRTPATTGSVLVGGLSARTVRDIARVNNMLGLRPLPPEMRRSLQPGQALPQNIVYHEMPANMRARLPVVDGHEWRIAGIDLLLVDSGTMQVADILRGPFR